MEVQTNMKNKQWPQYLAVLIASISSYAVGLHYSWSSPSVPKLLADDYHIDITPEEVSTIAIMFPIGAIVGAPVMAHFADIIGRKTGIILLAFPQFIAWMMIAFAQNIIMLYIGRFVAGISEGFILIVCPMYAGEVTDPNIRGTLGCLLSIGSIIGMITMNAYAPYTSVRDTALIASILPIILVATFVWMPESPYFYLINGQEENAKKSLKFLKRGDIEDDFKQMKKDVERQMSERGTWKDLFCIKSNRNAMLICLGIRLVQQSSGISAFSLFTQTIFMQAGGDLSPIISTLIYLVLQLVMTIFGSFLLEKFGRKPLVILSSSATAITLFIGGVFFYLKEASNIDTSSFSWLPLPLMLCFILLYSIGLGTIPGLMLSELFSASIKGKALCIMCMFHAGMMSFVSKLFYFLIDFYGMYVAFFCCSIALFTSILFLYYFMPETKGKSLEDIQQYFKGNDLDRK